MFQSKKNIRDDLQKFRFSDFHTILFFDFLIYGVKLILLLSFYVLHGKKVM